MGFPQPARCDLTPRDRSLITELVEAPESVMEFPLEFFRLSSIICFRRAASFDASDRDSYPPVRGAGAAVERHRCLIHSSSNSAENTQRLPILVAGT